MKIKLTDNELNKLQNLLNRKETNIAVADLLNDLCFSLTSFPSLKENKDNNVNNIISTIYDYYELDETNNENQEIINEYLLDSFKQIDLKEYNSNPYKKDVIIKDIIQNPYKITYLSYPPYSFFPLDDIKVDEENEYKEISQIAYAKEEYKYLALIKNNNIWMCITPNEINTMNPYIAKAHGDVITFGLGLGYYAYMVSLKNNVKSVTIIERDDNIINLFSRYLLPYFKYKDKIHIIKDDVFKYIEAGHLNKYDYAFYDLWHNANDGIKMYLKIKEINNIEVGYWIEESLICMTRRILLTVIEESLLGYGDDKYRKTTNDIDYAINYLYFKTKNLIFNNYKDIYKFLSKENILKLISK